MNFRNFLAGVVAVLTLLGIVTLVAIVVTNLWPDYNLYDHQIDRLILLMFAALMASTVYNMIKIEETEDETKEKPLTTEEISEKLAQKRKSLK